MMLIFMRLVFCLFVLCLCLPFIHCLQVLFFSFSSLWDGLDRQGAGNGPQPREIAQQVKPLAVEVWQLKPQLWWQTHTHACTYAGRWEMETGDCLKAPEPASWSTVHRQESLKLNEERTDFRTLAQVYTYSCTYMGMVLPVYNPSP